MKHLRIFNALNDYKGATLYYPSVSYITDNKTVMYDKAGVKTSEYKLGDYLLSDLKTKVKQADLTDDQKGDVVGICIGQNPVNGKDVFFNLKAMSGEWGDNMFYDPADETYKDEVGYKFDASKFNTYAPTEYHTTYDKWGADSPKNNVDMIAGIPGYITAVFDIKEDDPDWGNAIFFINDFAGKQNTIEWYKQAVAAGIDIENEMPALWSLINDVNGLYELTDDFDGWFLGSVGHAYLFTSYNNGTINDLYAEDIEASYKNITGDDLPGDGYWMSSFCCLDSGHSHVFRLGLSSDYCYVSDSDVGNDYCLFAIIER